VVQVVECLPNRYEALSSNPSIVEERGDQKRNRQAGVMTTTQGERRPKQRDKT
jgi:hypothetical protein